MINENKAIVPKLIRIKEVAKLTTFSKTNIYLLARQGLFPKPTKLGLNSSVWVESEVIDWINHKLENNRVGA